MIINANEKNFEIRENMRGGGGQVVLSSFLAPDAMPKNCRLFSELKFEKDCGIGYHIHEKECEIFYVLAGEALYNDNGVEKILKQGDVAICPSGTSHGVRNEKAEPLILLAFIVLE